jgi:hypothetical protein
MELVVSAFKITIKDLIAVSFTCTVTNSEICMENQTRQNRTLYFKRLSTLDCIQNTRCWLR